MKIMVNQARYLLIGLLCLAGVGCSTTSEVQKTQNVVESAEASVVEPSQSKEAPAVVATRAEAKEVVEAKPVVVEAKPVEAPDAVVEVNVPEDEAVLGDLTRCEAKIEDDGSVYTGESLAPTIEEAREAAIEEACANPCAEQLVEEDSETDREDKLERCIETCAYDAIVIAVQCWHDGSTVYTEGAWSSTNDAAPTNGEESPEPSHSR